MTIQRRVIESIFALRGMSLPDNFSYNIPAIDYSVASDKIEANCGQKELPPAKEKVSWVKEEKKSPQFPEQQRKNPVKLIIFSSP